MARFLLVCERDGSVPQSVWEQRLRRAMALPGLPEGETVVHRDEGSASVCAIRAPAGALPSADDGRIVIGQAGIDDAEIPDGCYAIIERGEHRIRLISDASASRSIWFYFDSERLLASSSQRALVALLGNHETNEAAVAWWLCNGQLGPGNAWDRRLRLLPARTRLNLDVRGWRMDLATESRPKVDGVLATADDFEMVLRAAVAAVDLPSDRCLLTLSGGYDSRLLACLFAEQHPLPTVTWGLERRGNPEAAVAAAVAARLRLPHEYLTIALGQEPPERVLERFLAIGEGRTDSLFGYLDGFVLWRQLAGAGRNLLIRGDEPFGGYGWRPVRTEQAVRVGVGLAGFADRPGTMSLASELSEARLPVELARRAEELLEVWRHRLYLDYRLPTALAALNELKSPFVDVISPMLFRSVIDVAVLLPLSLRNDKQVLVDLTRRLSPRVPYRGLREGDEQALFFQQPVVQARMLEDLEAAVASGYIPSALLAMVVAGLGRSAEAGRAQHVPILGRLARWLKASTPEPIKARLRGHWPVPAVDPRLLLFRAWVWDGMRRRLCDDAALKQT